MVVGSLEITRGPSFRDMVAPIEPKKPNRPALVAPFRLSSAEGWHVDLRHGDHSQIGLESHIGAVDDSPDAPNSLH